MAALFALSAAVAYGVGDFLGGFFDAVLVFTAGQAAEGGEAGEGEQKREQSKSDFE